MFFSVRHEIRDSGALFYYIQVVLACRRVLLFTVDWERTCAKVRLLSYHFSSKKIHRKTDQKAFINEKITQMSVYLHLTKRTRTIFVTCKRNLPNQYRPVRTTSFKHFAKSVRNTKNQSLKIVFQKFFV